MHTKFKEIVGIILNNTVFLMIKGMVMTLIILVAAARLGYELYCHFIGRVA